MINKAIALLLGLIFTMVLGAGIYGEKKPEFIFNWPVPCDFTVTEKVIKKGNSSKIKHQIRLEGTQDPNILKVTWVDVEFLEVNGVAVNTPEMRKVLESQWGNPRNLYFDFLINKKGEFQKVDNIEKKLSDSTKLIKRMSNNQAAMEKSLNPEIFKAFITNTVRNKWLIWAEAWQEYSVSDGESITIDFDEMVLGRIMMRMKATYTNLGKSKKYPGCVHLKVTGKPDEAEVKKVIKTIFGQFSSQGSGQQELNKMLETANLKVETVQETIVDPLTLKPSWAYSRRDFELSASGIDGAKQYESHEYLFIWPK